MKPVRFPTALPPVPHRRGGDWIPGDTDTHERLDRGPAGEARPEGRCGGTTHGLVPFSPTAEIPAPRTALGPER